MKKKIAAILTCCLLTLTACSFSGAAGETETTALTAPDVRETIAGTEDSAAESSELNSAGTELPETESSAETDDSATAEPMEESSEETTKTTAGTTAEPASSLDMEAAFALAGILVEKNSTGYLLTYPAGSLNEQQLAELEESYGSNNIITNNEDGSTTFRLTDEEYSYMADRFNQSRNPSAD